MALDPRKKDESTLAYNRAMQESFLGAPKGNVPFSAGQAAGSVANTATGLYQAGKQNLQDNLVKTGAMFAAPAVAIERAAKDFGAGLSSTQAPVPRTERPVKTTSGKTQPAATPTITPTPAPAPAPAPALDRTGNTDPAVIAELAAKRARAAATTEAAKPVVDPNDITASVRQGITRGYEAPKRQAAPEFNPAQELYDRAQSILAGIDSNATDFNSQIKAAIARKQARTLMDTAVKYQSEQGAMSRAGMQEAGATERTQMQQAGESERAALTRANELERTRMTTAGQLANTSLQQQMALAAKMQEMAAKENLPSTQLESLYKAALTGKATTEQAQLLQKYNIGEEYLAAAPGTPEQATAASRLASIQGRTGPEQTAFLKMLNDAANDVTSPPETRNQAKELLSRMAGVAKFAEGGAVRRAEPVPMNTAAPTAGMPDIRPQMQMVSDYRAYASAAARLGATPVSFDQFAGMKAAAAPAPTPMGFAEGGMIGVNNSVLEQPMAPQSQGTTAGTIAEFMRLAGVDGYAEGGAIKVSGKQVIGHGTSKSDSIPAIIDGTRPAALSTGEYVMPVAAVRHYGIDKLNKMVEAARSSSSA